MTVRYSRIALIAMHTDLHYVVACLYLGIFLLTMHAGATYMRQVPVSSVPGFALVLVAFLSLNGSLLYGMCARELARRYVDRKCRTVPRAAFA